jgi:non-ribosomal peptide synthetase component F
MTALDHSIGDRFAQVAAEHASKIAVSAGGAHLTYAELEARANDLALSLRELGVGHESMVGCCCHRSLDLIVALLAILKAGGCYVPLDPAYPAERLKFMLDDTACAAVVTTSDLAGSLPPGHGLRCRNSPGPAASPMSCTRRVRPAGRRACWSSIARSSGW